MVSLDTACPSETRRTRPRCTAQQCPQHFAGVGLAGAFTDRYKPHCYIVAKRLGSAYRAGRQGLLDQKLRTRRSQHKLPSCGRLARRAASDHLASTSLAEIGQLRPYSVCREGPFYALSTRSGLAISCNADV